MPDHVHLHTARLVYVKHSHGRATGMARKEARAGSSAVQEYTGKQACPGRKLLGDKRARQNGSVGHDGRPGGSGKVLMGLLEGPGRPTLAASFKLFGWQHGSAYSTTGATPARLDVNCTSVHTFFQVAAATTPKPHLECNSLNRRAVVRICHAPC